MRLIYKHTVNSRPGCKINTEIGTSRRGHKTNIEVVQELAQVYEARNQDMNKSTIQGWEVETDSEEVSMEEQLSHLNFLTDPGNTRGRVFLFEQSIKTYWKMKCLLAMALAATERKSLISSILSELQQVKMDMHAISKIQIQLNDQVGKLEQQVQLLHRRPQVVGQAETTSASLVG